MVFQKRFTQFTSFLCPTPTIAFTVLMLNKFHVVEFFFISEARLKGEDIQLLL